MAVLRRRESPFARRARERLARQRVRERAPKHPATYEAGLRLAVSRLFGVYHKQIRAQVVAHTKRHLDNRVRGVAVGVSADDYGVVPVAHGLYVTAADGDVPPTDIPLMMLVFSELWSFGRHLLTQSAFKTTVRESAEKTANSVKRQVGVALDKAPIAVDLSAETAALHDGIYDMAAAKMQASLERASDVLDEWSDLDPETSPRAEDLDALDTMLDDGLDGILGGALGSVALAYGYAFGNMSRVAQESEDVATYMWCATHDSRVRPEHLALDGETCSWDDEPLAADESSIGEACHAGEDVNCRCVASPFPPGEDTTISGYRGKYRSD